MSGGAVGQRGDLFLRARLSQAVQQRGQNVRGAERDVDGGVFLELGGVAVQAASVGGIT